MIYKLKDICSLKSGGTPRRGEVMYYGGSIPWAKITDFAKAKDGIINETNEYITEKGLESINNRLFDKGTLLLAMYGSIGKVAIAGRKLSCNQAILGITPKSSSLLNIRFLKYWFEFKKEYFKSKGRGAALLNISATIVKNEEIDLPDLETQNKIVEILDRTSDLMNRRHQSINFCNELIKSIFLKMFQQSLLDIKKSGTKLSNIASIISGITKGRKTKETNFIKVPYLRVANAQDGYFDLSEIKYIDATPNEVGRYTVKLRDILITEGGDPDKLGRGAVWEDEENKFIYQNHLYRIRLNDDKKYSAYWLSYLMQSEFGKGYFLSQAKQTTGIATINKRQVCNLPIPKIPFTKQDEFEIKYLKIIQNQSTLKEGLVNIETLFNSLLQKVFSGNFNFDITTEVDSLLKEINLEKEENDIVSIATNEEYVINIVDRLNQQNFESQQLYDRAKHVAFQLLKQEERIEQVFDKKTKSLKLSAI